jgi:DNA-binding GntR family transcriptional regulator
MTTLRNQAYKIIKDKIIYLQVKPGESLFDSELAKEIGIGRTPIREALLMLVSEKLVESKNKSGYRVRKLSRKEAHDYFAIRQVFEGFAIPLIIEGLTDDIIAELEKNIETAKEHAEKNDFYKFIRYETGFHEILYRATNSKVFVEAISGIVDKFQWLRAISLSMPGGIQESLEDHIKILAAYKARDISEIKEITELHILHAREKFGSMEHIIF